MNCFCSKEKAKYYCQECRHYLCSSCSDYHKILPMSANHKLHSVEDMRSMTPFKIASLHHRLCNLHNEPLNWFCCKCNIPICMHCTISDHNSQQGNHKPISISKAFQTFKETAEELEKTANDCESKLQDSLKAIIQNAKKLEQSKDKSLSDIDNHVQEIVKKVKENGNKIKNKVETLYKRKKKVTDVQIDELKTTISDMNTKISFLSQLLESDEVTAMESSGRVITALKDRINEFPKAEPDDYGEITFFINKQQMVSLQQCDIGNVTEMRAANSLTLKGEESVIQGKKFVVKVMKTDECEIHANQLKATWTQPTGETNITQVEEDDNGDFFATGTCTSPGVCKLDVSADGKPIKQSPMEIKVEKVGLVNSIQIHNNGEIGDVVVCEDNCLLVSNLTNVIRKYKLSGKPTLAVVLPQGVKVYRMFKMENSKIAFTDSGNNDIKICNMNGTVIKSIRLDKLKHQAGIYVDEASNMLYVTQSRVDTYTFNFVSVFMLDIDTGKIIRKIGGLSYNECQMNGVKDAIDISISKQGQLLVLETCKGLQTFNIEREFMKVLVGEGDKNGMVKYPSGVVVDEDDNIIISSCHKLQLFSSDGNFIKRIDKPEDSIKYPRGLSIIHPRRVAVANNGDKTVKIFNY
ncbi:E3 ubiquitin-protein ligase TRIM71-like [Anneissia japonica]|uniref:E3 ubiquitin-protein ligase TRIM71-like n=1 Tax=Anneissia japonica TaxID=1529436 RepID=UPI0014256066|nr:E3 ubiquitin-protein ligase TRIM71-like [Anneissia japonica]